MAKILSKDNIFPPSEKYPIDIILVDTNIIIEYTDPFGSVPPTKNTSTVSYLNRLKSHYKLCSTIVSAIEFYKYLQVGSYNIYSEINLNNNDKFSITSFKRLRQNDSNFLYQWELRLKVFKTTFKKHFPTYDINDHSIYNENLINSFDGKLVDFPDEIIYTYAKHLKYPIIITKDRDFKNYSDEITLLML